MVRNGPDARKALMFVSDLRENVHLNHPAYRYRPALNGITCLNTEIQMNTGDLKIDVGDALS